MWPEPSFHENFLLLWLYFNTGKLSGWLRPRCMSTLCQKSWVSSGYSGSLPQEKLRRLVRCYGPTCAVIGLSCCGVPILVIKPLKSNPDGRSLCLQKIFSHSWIFYVFSFGKTNLYELMSIPPKRIHLPFRT